MPHTCVHCGAGGSMVPFAATSFPVHYAGDSVIVEGLSGLKCEACDEIEFDDNSAMRYAEAGDQLVLKARETQSREIRRIRRKLGLSQTEAARITGGGHNAFSRYERGEASPMPAVVNLFRLLDRHPELLRELV